MMTITAERPAGIDFAAARRAMIDSQLRVSGVNQDWVLAAMNAVPREDFVPETARAHAYIDRAIPLGDGEALAAPLVHGTMLAEAAPQPGEQVLLVSNPDGYLAALLRQVGASVTAMPAATAAAHTGSGGFALLLIDGAIEHLPQGLAAALDDGGRIVTGLVERGVTRLAAGRSVAGQAALLPLADMGIPVLSAFAAPKQWSF